VAVALDDAKGCAGKAELLDRVKQSGDQRAVDILEPLTRGTSKGCGFLGLGACPSQCPKQAKAMRDAVDDVKQRLAKE